MPVVRSRSTLSSMDDSGPVAIPALVPSRAAATALPPPFDSIFGGLTPLLDAAMSYSLTYRLGKRPGGVIARPLDPLA